MKNIKTMKSMILGAVLLALPTAAFADFGPTGTPTPKPRPQYEEGTESILDSRVSTDDIEWAQNTLLSIKDVEESVKRQGINAQKQTLLAQIETMVPASASKRTETLLRVTLNRALVINDIIEREALEEGRAGKRVAAGTVDQQVRILKKSLELAKKYYQSDIMYMNEKIEKKDQNLVKLDWASFGLEYSDMLWKVSNSLFDASAQYNVMLKAIDWYAVSLKNDKYRYAYEPVIASIATQLKAQSRIKVTSDTQYVMMMRDLRFIYRTAKEKAAQVSAQKR